MVKDGEQLPIVPGSRRHRMSNLGTTLAERGHEVTWWCSTHSHQTKSCLYPQDQTLEVSPRFNLRLLHAGGYERNLSWQRLLHHNRFAWKLYHQMKDLPPADAVVCCLPIVEAILACYLYTRQARIPLIVDVRDPWPDVWLDRVPPPLKPLAAVALSPYYLVTRTVFSRTEALVAVSNRLLHWACRAGRRTPGPHDAVIVHGVHPQEPVDLADSPRIRTALEKLKGKLVFSFAGAFNLAYDLETVCRGALELQDRSDIHFLMAGDGPSHSDLESKYGQLPNITFLGWLERVDLNALLQHSQVALIPYREDLLGSKAYEYMAAALPMIVPAFGAVQELIAHSESGLLYEVGNAHDFAARVVELADNPDLLERLSQCALRAFQNEYSASRVYGRYADLIEMTARG